MQHAKLCLSEFKLPVYLGWGDAEREETQVVTFDIRIDFASLPSACDSDVLSGTLCYDQLTQGIREHVEGQTFRLIEHLAQTVFHLIRSQCQDGDQIELVVSKVPPIEGLSQASFVLSDFIQS